jgi:hypothetical protein
MAIESRHAATQNRRSYAVRLLSAPAGPVDLAEGFTEFLDATDFALEWLDQADPVRERVLELVILEIRAGENKEVWRYPAAQQRDPQRLVELFGFDPVAWKAGARYESAGVPPARPRLPAR